MLHKRLLIAIFFTILVISNNCFAFNQIDLNEEFTEGFIEDFSADIQPLQVTGDAIKWEIFAQTKEDMKCTIDEEGFDNCLIKPIYAEKIKKLNNQQVTLTGFMFPLDATEKQKNFLIGPYPASCPFNYHVGPAQIVEVILNKPIDFSYDPVTVKGTLSLQYNQETGIFYYLRQN